MQRYALQLVQLVAYSYDVELRRSADMRVADTSRLPLPAIVDKEAERIETETRESNVLYMDEGPTVTARKVKTTTRCDRVLENSAGGNKFRDMARRGNSRGEQL